MALGALPAIGGGGGNYKGADDYSTTAQTDELNLNASQNYGTLDFPFDGRGRGRPGMAGALAEFPWWILGAAAFAAVALVVVKRVR